MNYWLMKTEPSVYSIDDLGRDGITQWEGVRNYQARNFMRDDMKIDDLVLFYHSNSDPSGIAGIARVCRESYPDHFSWNHESRYFDPKSTPETPRWFMVDVEYVKKFNQIISLKELKENPLFEGMLVTKRGMRISVQPVEKTHFDLIEQFSIEQQ